jgi:predicted nucleic acid-binding protein
MILVDSSVWIDYFNGYNTTETTELDLLLGVNSLSLTNFINYL